MSTNTLVQTPRPRKLTLQQDEICLGLASVGLCLLAITLALMFPSVADALAMLN